MKLFIIAALVAVAAAGRLEHLERSYLPPDNFNSVSSGQGFRSGPSARGSQGFGNQGSNGFGSHGSNGFGNHGSNDLNNGFQSHGSADAFNGGDDSHASNGFGSSGSNGFGSNGALNAASLKQYLPPDQPSSGSGLGFSGSSIRPACATCGFARQQYSSSQFAQQPNQYAQQPSSQYAQQSSSHFAQQPSSQYGQPQFGAASFNNYAGPRASFGQATNRQYLAPKTQEIPQQPFDEQTGYHY